MQFEVCTRYMVCAYKALRSQGKIEQNANEADNEVCDLRCKLTSSKCQELHGPRKQPGRHMHVRNRGRKTSVVF